MPADFPAERHIVTRSGSFRIPGDLFDDGREHDLMRFYARNMPDDAKPAGRLMVQGAVIQKWRVTTVRDGPRP
jgi:hypothetical protein